MHAQFFMALFQLGFLQRATQDRHACAANGIHMWLT